MIAEVFALVAARAELTGIESYLGADFLSLNSAAQRIVWVPVNASFRPGRVQASLTPGNVKDADGNLIPRSVATRVANVRCRVWAKGAGEGNVADSSGEILALELLMERLIVAVHRVCWGSASIVSEEWVDQDGGSLMEYGRAADVVFSFELPVVPRSGNGLPANVSAIRTTSVFGDDEETDTFTPVSMIIDPSTDTIAAGDSVQLTATATYNDGSERDVTAVATWTTSSAAIATVAGGLVQGVEASLTDATITATLKSIAGDVSAQSLVTVT